MIWTTISMALREIRRNGLRSLLTMLGVVIGVGAVIALVSVGRGATAKVTEDIAKLAALQRRLLDRALGLLKPGGRLVINAIRKEDGDKDIMSRIRYRDHLWMEKEIKTVANVTRHDLSEFLPLAAQVPLKPEIEMYELEDANRALVDLKYGAVRGAKVLRVGRELAAVPVMP